jgi:hypothetical protein
MTIYRHFASGLVAAALALACSVLEARAATILTNWMPHGGPSGVHAVACSVDGTKLVAAGSSSEGGDWGIYTSTNSGLTWTTTSAPTNSWMSVASSADGTKLVAAAYLGFGSDGFIYTSTNSGLTWTPTSAPANSWASVASSADGTKLVAAANLYYGDGLIYASTNSGLTWTPANAPSNYWTSVASSADGTKWVAAGALIYSSANSGLTWATASAPANSWSSVASSADGTKLVAAAALLYYQLYSDGLIYTSTNSGLTWTPTGASTNVWTSVASSADGTKLVAAAPVSNGGDGFIYASTNSGLTWTPAGAPRAPWSCVVSSSDGTKLAAVFPGGMIYTYPAESQTLATPALTWTSPAAITYGTALSSNQLNATVSVPGSFAYTPPSGTVLHAGANTLSVIFTPTDTVDYSSAATSVSLVVLSAPLTVTAANASRAYGQTNPVFTGTLTGVTNWDNITATYGCSATTSSPAGTYAIVPSLADPNGRLVNYSAVTNNGTLTVIAAAPLLTWTSPAAITYGTPLSSNQLNATANVLGTFAYNPTNGVVLNTGTNILTVIFTPTDTLDYTSAIGTVSLVVWPAPPKFQSMTGAGGGFSFTWSTAPGWTYQVQYKTNLSQPGWLNLGSAMVATNAAMTAADATTNSSRFYRAVLLP